MKEGVEKLIGATLCGIVLNMTVPGSQLTLLALCVARSSTIRRLITKHIPLKAIYHTLRDHLTISHLAVAPVCHALAIEVVVGLDVETLGWGMTVDAKVEEVRHSLQHLGLGDIYVRHIGKLQLCAIARHATKDGRNATPRVERHLLTLHRATEADVIKALGLGGANSLVGRTHIHHHSARASIRDITLIECPVARILDILSATSTPNPEFYAAVVRTEAYGSHPARDITHAIEAIATQGVVVEDEEPVCHIRYHVVAHIDEGVVQNHLDIAVVGQVQLREALQIAR